MVQVATGTKGKISELVKGCPLSMNGLNTIAYLNIIHLGSYDVLIRMDWLDTHHAGLDCYNKTFTCLNEEGNGEMVKGIRMPISIKKISCLQLNKCLRKGCHFYTTHA